MIGFSPRVEPPAPGARSDSTSPCSKSGWQLQAARAGAAVGPGPVGDLQAAVAEDRGGTVSRRLPEVDDQHVARHGDVVLEELEAAAHEGVHADEDAAGPLQGARRHAGAPHGKGDGRHDPGRVHPHDAAAVGDRRVDGVNLALQPGESRPRELDDHPHDLGIARDTEVGGRELCRGARGERQRDERRGEQRDGQRDERRGPGARHGWTVAHPQRSRQAARGARLPAPSRIGILPRCSWTPRTP